MGLVRSWLIALNGLLVLAGAGLIGVGFWAANNSFGGEWTAYAIGAVGIVIFILAFVGYKGAKDENRALLGFYGLLVGILTILLIVFAILCFTQQDLVIDTIKKQCFDEGQSKCVNWARKLGIPQKYISLITGCTDTPTALEQCTKDLVDWAKANVQVAGGIAIAVFVLTIGSTFAAFHVRSKAGLSQDV